MRAPALARCDSLVASPLARSPIPRVPTAGHVPTHHHSPPLLPPTPPTPSGFVHSHSLHEWFEWGLSQAEQPELLLQLVQLGRLLQRLAIVVEARIPRRLDQSISAYVHRELSSSALMLRPNGAPALLRRPMTPSVASLAASYEQLCVLDLAAVQMLRCEPPLPSAADGAASAEALVNEDADTSRGADGSGGSSKRRRVELSHPHPAWLARLLCLESGPSPPSSTAAHAAAHLPQHPLLADEEGPALADSASWARRLLVLTAVTRRSPTPLPAASTHAAVRKVLPMATRTIDDEPELQMCALLALLALAPQAPHKKSLAADGSAAVIGAGSQQVWEHVWAQVWSCERPRWSAEVATPAAAAVTSSAPAAGAAGASGALHWAGSAAYSVLGGNAALVSELRVRLLSQLYLSGVIGTVAAAAASVEAVGGCHAAAASANLPRQTLASCLLSALPAGSMSGGDIGHPTALDILGRQVECEYDDAPCSVADAALVLHPAVLVCTEAHTDAPSLTAHRWSAARLQFALCAAGLSADAVAPPPPALVSMRPLAAAAGATASLPRTTARHWHNAGWAALPGDGHDIADDVATSGALGCRPWHADLSYLVEMARGAAVDSEGGAIMHTEVELLQLDALCAEALRSPHPYPHQADAAPRLSVEDEAPNGRGGAVGTANDDVQARGDDSSNGFCSGADGLSDGSVGAGITRGGAPLTLPPHVSAAMDAASAALAEKFSMRQPSLLAHFQRLISAAQILSLPPPSSSVDTDGRDTLRRQLQPSMAAACSALTNGADARCLALLPPLIRALAASQWWSSGGIESGHGGRPPLSAASCTVSALALLTTTIVARVASLVRQPERLDTGPADAHAALDAVMMDVDDDEALESPSGSAPRADGGGGGGGGFGPLGCGWLASLEEVCRLPPSSKPPTVQSLQNLLDLAATRGGASHVHASTLFELCLAVLPYRDATVRSRALALLDESVGELRLHSPKQTRVAVELATSLLTMTAAYAPIPVLVAAAGPPTAASSSDSTASRQALLAIQSATLVGCAPLMMRGMDAWEDAPIEDAAAMAHAAIAFLRLGSLVPPSQQPESPSPRTLAMGMLGLFRLHRSVRHADLLRLQGLLLPALPALFALRPPAELLPTLRDASRCFNPKGIDAKVAAIFPALLTSTAVIRSCPQLTRPMLWDLCSIPQVTRGLDQRILPLIRARCASAGGLDALMAAHIQSLIASWLDAGWRLVAFPHHWLTASEDNDPVTRETFTTGTLTAGGKREHKYRAFAGQHTYAMLPPLLERALGVDSAHSKRATGELEPLERLLSVRVSQLVVAFGSPATPAAPKGCAVEILGCWLPLKSQRGQPKERSWEQIAPRLEKLFASAASPEADADIAQKAFPHMPRISHMLTSSCDGLLLAMLSHLAGSSLDGSGDGGGAPGATGGTGPSASAGGNTTEGARDGLSPTAVREAVDVLARASSLPSVHHLMCESSSRVMDLLLLLHYSRHGSLGHGTRRLSNGPSILPALELLTLKGGLLPPMLTPPSTLSENARTAFPLAAISRLLQHTAICRLPKAAAFARGPTARREAAVTLQRCCAVLKAVLEAVVTPTGEARRLGADAKQALLRHHCVTLTDAVLPVAAAANNATNGAVEVTGASTSAVPDTVGALTAGAAAEATKLLEFAVKALPASARATLPAFPRAPLFASLAATCGNARASTPLSDSLFEFAQVSDRR